MSRKWARRQCYKSGSIEPDPQTEFVCKCFMKDGFLGEPGKMRKLGRGGEASKQGWDFEPSPDPE